MSHQKPLYRVPLVLTPQAEGGFTVTSAVLPELVTEGDTAKEALANVQDALAATIELYADLGKPLPPMLAAEPEREPIRFEYLISGG